MTISMMDENAHVLTVIKLRLNKTISVFRVTGLKNLSRVDTNFLGKKIHLSKSIKLYFFQ